MTSLLRAEVCVPMPSAASSDDDLAAGQRQRPRHREADDAGPDHEAIDIAHGAASASAARGIAVSTSLAQ